MFCWYIPYANLLTLYVPGHVSALIVANVRLHIGHLMLMHTKHTETAVEHVPLCDIISIISLESKTWMVIPFD